MVGELVESEHTNFPIDLDQKSISSQAFPVIGDSGKLEDKTDGISY